MVWPAQTAWSPMITVLFMYRILKMHNSKDENLTDHNYTVEKTLTLILESING